MKLAGSTHLISTNIPSNDDPDILLGPIHYAYRSIAFYDFILDHGSYSPGLNRMRLKKDMRNDNVFFKRVTDIIIPAYPLLFIDM